MRLLIVTQKVDRADPILGFFHRWIEEFAKHCEKVTVIAQSVRDHHFPPNVHVYSLGKEEKKPRWLQILRFRNLIRKLRNDHDAVLVHMTPVWVALGWPWANPVYLWYEARGARWPLRIALKIVRKVFSASEHGMPVRTAKSIVTGHGIDTDAFAPGQEPRNPHHIVTVGRMTASKRLPVILDAFASLPAQYRLSIFGPGITPADAQVRRLVNEHVQSLEVTDRVDMQSLSQSQIVHELRRAMMFLHASATSLDKAVLEAMSCGCLVASCADALKGVLPADCWTTPEHLGLKAQEILDLPADRQEQLRRELRQVVQEKHSLPRLIQRLVQEMA